MNEKLYTINEVCEVLRISRDTYYEWVKKGKLTTIKLSKNVVRIKQSELDRLLQVGTESV